MRQRMPHGIITTRGVPAKLSVGTRRSLKSIGISNLQICFAVGWRWDERPIVILRLR